jgi:hypothetical protein
VADRFRWLQRRAPEIREQLAKRVVLKFLPHFTYVLDKSADKVATRPPPALDEIGARPAGANRPPSARTMAKVLS